jgi:outer membrane biosynthesis protein TonB
VVSATNPEFGAMAAAAVAQWLFEEPMKGGKPTAVTVLVPFRFTPPPQG